MNNLKSVVVLLARLCFFLFALFGLSSMWMAQGADASEISWIGGSGSWLNATNWSPPQVPTTNDSVVITNGFVAPPPNFSFNNLVLRDGTIIGPISVAGSFEWAGGVVSSTLTINSGGALHIRADGDRPFGFGTVTNWGIATWTNTWTLYLPSGAALWYNMPGSLFQADDDGRITRCIDSDCVIRCRWGESCPSLEFHNAGVFRKLHGTNTTTFEDTTFYNSGLVDVESGALQFGHLVSNGDYSGGGVVRLGAVDGVLRGGNFEAPVGLAGKWTLTGEARLTWSAGLLNGAGTIDAGSCLKITGNSAKYLSGLVTNRGTVSWTGSGDLYFGGSESVWYNQPGSVFEVLNGLSLRGSTAVFCNGGLFRNMGNGGVTGTSTSGVLFTNSGTLDVQTGEVDFGAYTQLSEGTLTVEIGGLAPGSEFGRVAVAGTAVLDGTLSITLRTNFTPALGDRFSAMTFAARVGGFSHIAGVEVGSNRWFHTYFTETNLVLAVLDFPPPDTNAPVITIRSPTSNPTFRSENRYFSLAGDATDRAGIEEVRWTNSRGGQGIASGASLWTINFLPLEEGTNLITVFAQDRAGNVGTDIITVTYGDPDHTAPALTVTSHTNGQSAPSRIVTLSGTASDAGRGDNGIRAVTVNGGAAPGGAVSGSGTAYWQRTVTLSDGPNAINIVASDNSAHQNPALLSLMLNYTPSNSAPLALEISGSGSVTPFLGGRYLELNRSYTVTAGPAPGYLFSDWVVYTNGSFARATTDPRLTFVMQSNLALRVYFVPNPFIPLKGTYTGLFYETNDMAWDNAGFFTLALTEKGTYSGKLLLVGAGYPLSGTFDLALASKKVAKNIIPRRTTNALLVCLQLLEGSDGITGAVSNANFQSELFGYRSGFSAANPATIFAGKLTALLAGTNEDAVAGPIGDGIAAITVANNGSVVFKGTLADGTPAVQIVPLAANRQFPIYRPLYSGKGSILGWLGLVNETNTDLTGPMLWTKTSVTSGNFYRSGFTNGLETVGSRYHPPRAGVQVLDFTNAVVRLEGGNLTAPLTNDVLLSALNRVTVTSTNTNKLALTVSASAGTFSGSFLNPATKKTSPIKGVLLQKQNVGGGFFLGTNQSGLFYLGKPDYFPLLSP